MFNIGSSIDSTFQAAQIAREEQTSAIMDGEDESGEMQGGDMEIESSSDLDAVALALGLVPGAGGDSAMKEDDAGTAAPEAASAGGAEAPMDAAPAGAEPAAPAGILDSVADAAGGEGAAQSDGAGPGASAGAGPDPASGPADAGGGLRRKSLSTAALLKAPTTSLSLLLRLRSRKPPPVSPTPSSFPARFGAGVELRACHFMRGNR